MPKYFNFTRLINKYHTEFKVVLPSNRWDEQQMEYIEGEPIEKTLTGAIINFTEAKRYRNEGVISEKDMRLFMLDPLSNEFIEAFVIYNGNRYKIEQSTVNAEFTGVYSYLLRWVSVFGGN